MGTKCDNVGLTSYLLVDVLSNPWVELQVHRHARPTCVADYANHFERLPSQLVLSRNLKIQVLV